GNRGRKNTAVLLPAGSEFRSSRWAVRRLKMPRPDAWFGIGCPECSSPHIKDVSCPVQHLHLKSFQNVQNRFVQLSVEAGGERGVYHDLGLGIAALQDGGIADDADVRHQ